MTDTPPEILTQLGECGNEIKNKYGDRMIEADWYGYSWINPSSCADWPNKRWYDPSLTSYEELLSQQEKNKFDKNCSPGKFGSSVNAQTVLGNYVLGGQGGACEVNGNSRYAYCATDKDYLKKNKKPCCTGKKDNNEDCATCWVRGSPACDEYNKEYLERRNGTGLNLSVLDRDKAENNWIEDFVKRKGNKEWVARTYKKSLGMKVYGEKNCPNDPDTGLPPEHGCSRLFSKKIDPDDPQYDIKYFDKVPVNEKDRIVKDICTNNQKQNLVECRCINRIYDDLYNNVNKKVVQDTPDGCWWQNCKRGGPFYIPSDVKDDNCPKIVCSNIIDVNKADTVDIKNIQSKIACSGDPKPVPTPDPTPDPTPETKSNNTRNIIIYSISGVIILIVISLFLYFVIKYSK